MSLTIEATYENGVFVPLAKPSLPEHDRVRLTVESIPAGKSTTAGIPGRRANRIRLSEDLARQIVTDPELDINAR